MESEGYLQSKGTSFDELKAQFSGRKFGELVLHHVKKQSHNDTLTAIRGTLRELPPEFKPEMEAMIDNYNKGVYSKEFWSIDCGEALEIIVDNARKRFDCIDIKPSDDDLFDVFNIIVMNFASGAQLQLAMKKFIKKSVRKSWF